MKRLSFETLKSRIKLPLSHDIFFFHITEKHTVVEKFILAGLGNTILRSALYELLLTVRKLHG